MVATDAFYDAIAAHYHLIYADWEASVGRQAAQLDAIVAERLGPGPRRIVDVACGIGTQSLGLAALGHTIVAADPSRASVARAAEEARRRGLSIDFEVADMRACDRIAAGAFDVVLCADNALPHLLDERSIREALAAMARSLRPGGLVVLTVRDYATVDRRSPSMHPYGVRDTAEGPVAVFQVWRWDGDRYEVGMYFVKEPPDRPPELLIARAWYYAVSIDAILRILEEVGFVEVARLDGRFFQPVIVGRRP